MRERKIIHELSLPLYVNGKRLSLYSTTTLSVSLFGLVQWNTKDFHLFAGEMYWSHIAWGQAWGTVREKGARFSGANNNTTEIYLSMYAYHRFTVPVNASRAHPHFAFRTVATCRESGTLLTSVSLVNFLQPPSLRWKNPTCQNIQWWYILS